MDLFKLELYKAQLAVANETERIAIIKQLFDYIPLTYCDPITRSQASKPISNQAKLAATLIHQYISTVNADKLPVYLKAVFGNK